MARKNGRVGTEYSQEKLVTTPDYEVFLVYPTCMELRTDGSVDKAWAATEDEMMGNARVVFTPPNGNPDTYMDVGNQSIKTTYIRTLLNLTGPVRQALEIVAARADAAKRKVTIGKVAVVKPAGLLAKLGITPTNMVQTPDSMAE